MLLAKLHNQALKRVQMLSTLHHYSAGGHATALRSSQFLETPTTCATLQSPNNNNNNNGHSSTRIVCISDTHGKHNDISFLPRGNVLVHAGDFTKVGETTAVASLSRYFCQQRAQAGFDQVICIAGNHDLTFDEEYYAQSWSRRLYSFDVAATRQALEHCTYLQDSATYLATTKTTERHDKNDQNDNNDILVYGSPWTPKLFNWAFNLRRGEALQEVWLQIPIDTDVLVTHGPPVGRGDLTLHSGPFGCRDLLQTIQERVQPRLHIYGHIHEGYGTSFDGTTLYVNASSLDIGYEAMNPPIVIDLPHDQRQPAMVVKPAPLSHLGIYDLHDLIAWCNENGYHGVAQAVQEVCDKNDGETLAGLAPRDPFSLAYSSWAIGAVNSNNLFSGTAFQALCDQFGWKRRKHAPARRELRTALCQLHAQSFV